MVNSGLINKGQVDNFVKCLKLVPVYRIFCKNKPQAVKVKLLFIYKKKFRLKSLNKSFLYEQFCKNTRARFPHILFIIFQSIFMFRIDSVSSSLLEKLTQKTNHQLVQQSMISTHKYRKFNFESQDFQKLIDSTQKTKAEKKLIMM